MGFEDSSRFKVLKNLKVFRLIPTQSDPKSYKENLKFSRENVRATPAFQMVPRACFLEDKTTWTCSLGRLKPKETIKMIIKRDFYKAKG